MIWDKLAKQDFAVRVLKSHIAMKRLASTYLISGEEDAGNEEMALAFAMALNCSEHKLFEACDCPSCKKILNGNHPDVRWLGHPKDEEKSIKIETVRDMLSWVYLKPYEGAWKVFLIDGAERLTVEASNALLKTLEEPSAQTIFCLLVANKSHMLETIQSRTFELKLRPLAAAEPDAIFFKQELPGMGTEKWETFLDPYQNAEREDFKRLLVYMLYYFREKIRTESAVSKNNSQADIGPYLEAMSAVYETSEALDANANQKLSASRLAMQLRKIEV